ncbi:unnamed protein product [Rotaria sp. Silwood1]|nr:unnamed protein product [Rotaria sp. Silwood1]CAF1562157.1 unnamed protein product [Rotaria sp. Silwood1]
MISSFLDPSTYRFLPCDDKIEAETIIINEAKAHYAQVNANSSSSNQSSTVTPINKNERQDNQSIFLQNLFIACGFEPQTTTSIFKPSTIKEELAQYVTTISSYQSFSQYWYEKKDCLPILSSIVRKYNIMCSTSIDCESSFSIAGFVQRKNRSSLSPSTLRYSMLLREQNK